MQEDNKPYPIPTILYCNWHGGQQLPHYWAYIEPRARQRVVCMRRRLVTTRGPRAGNTPTDVRGREQTAKHATLDKLTAEMK